MFQPNLGRWMQEDPIGFAGGDVSLYRFVGNSPSGALDPFGLKDIDTAENKVKPVPLFTIGQDIEVAMEIDASTIQNGDQSKEYPPTKDFPGRHVGAFVLLEDKKGKDGGKCGHNKGVRVWVAFVQDYYRTSFIPGAPGRPALKKWYLDLPKDIDSPKKLVPTAESAWADYPGQDSALSKNGSWEVKTVVAYGIACRCKDNPQKFLNRLEDIGRIAIWMRYNKDTGATTVGVGSDQSYTGAATLASLTGNGEWINILDRDMGLTGDNRAFGVDSF